MRSGFIGLSGCVTPSEGPSQTIEELLENNKTPAIKIPFEVVGSMIDNGTLPPEVTFTEEERKLIHKIRYCHTAEGGYTVQQCPECGAKKIMFHSCRDRHCPICQKTNKLLWEEKRNSEIIDAPYGHLVFTVPHDLNGIILANKKVCLPIIQQAAMDSVVELARDQRFLGATPGGYAVLHTWNQHMEPHFHVHIIVPYAGITDDQKIVWRQSGDFFIPFKAMSDLFRGKIMAQLEDLRLQPDKLKFIGRDRQYINAWSWAKLKEKMYKDTKHWVTYGKEATPNAEAVTRYLAQYVNSICISDSRIISATSSKVVFRARKDGDANQHESVTVDPVTFVKRYCSHILPAGLHKVRYFGWMSNSKKKASLELFKQAQSNVKFHEFCYGNGSTHDIILSEYGIDIDYCPYCKNGKMIVYAEHKGFFTFKPKKGKKAKSHGECPKPRIKPKPTKLGLGKSGTRKNKRKTA